MIEIFALPCRHTTEMPLLCMFSFSWQHRFGVGVSIVETSGREKRLLAHLCQLSRRVLNKISCSGKMFEKEVTPKLRKSLKCGFSFAKVKPFMNLYIARESYCLRHVQTLLSFEAFFTRLT